jgi:hypothetical protein
VTHVTPSLWLLAAGDIGVIDMAFLSIIRRWALREHLGCKPRGRVLATEQNCLLLASLIQHM